MSENELAQAVPWEAEQFIPMPLSEVTLDWQIVKPAAVGKEMEKMKIFIVAAPTVLIKKYIDIAEMAGLNVAAIESESLALARALQTASSPFSILVNFGAKSTDLTIAAGQKILLTRSISTAGEALTRAIATNLVLEPGQAEEYKKAYGLEEKEAEGKIRKALLPVLDVLANEIQKTILAWKEKENQPLSGLILAGGSAGLAQIGLYLASKLGLEVQTADPFSSLTVDPNFIAKLKPNASLFSVAVGLAQKEI
jgi:type IV pilus assembly protein PilM